MVPVGCCVRDCRALSSKAPRHNPAYLREQVGSQLKKQAVLKPGIFQGHFHCLCPRPHSTGAGRLPAFLTVTDRARPQLVIVLNAGADDPLPWEAFHLFRDPLASTFLHQFGGCHKFLLKV